MLLTDFFPDSPYWVTCFGRGLFKNNAKGTWKKIQSQLYSLSMIIFLQVPYLTLFLTFISQCRPNLKFHQNLNSFFAVKPWLSCKPIL